MGRRELSKIRRGQINWVPVTHKPTLAHVPLKSPPNYPIPSISNPALPSTVVNKIEVPMEEGNKLFLVGTPPWSPSLLGDMTLHGQLT